MTRKPMIPSSSKCMTLYLQSEPPDFILNSPVKSSSDWGSEKEKREAMKRKRMKEDSIAAYINGGLLIVPTFTD